MNPGLLSLYALRGITAQHVHQLPSAVPLQHKPLVTGSGEALVQRIKEERVEPQGFTEAVHKVWPHQVCFILHYNQNLQYSQTK